MTVGGVGPGGVTGTAGPVGVALVLVGSEAVVVSVVDLWPQPTANAAAPMASTTSVMPTARRVGEGSKPSASEKRYMRPPGRGCRHKRHVRCQGSGVRYQGSGTALRRKYELGSCSGEHDLSRVSVFVPTQSPTDLAT